MTAHVIHRRDASHEMQRFRGQLGIITLRVRFHRPSSVEEIPALLVRES